MLMFYISLSISCCLCSRYGRVGWGCGRSNGRSGGSVGGRCCWSRWRSGSYRSGRGQDAGGVLRSCCSLVVLDLLGLLTAVARQVYIEGTALAQGAFYPDAP